MVYFDKMRMASAQARKMLLNAVASSWNVNVAELKTDKSIVSHAGSDRKISYEEIVVTLTLPTEILTVEKSEIKTESEYRSIAISVNRLCGGMFRLNLMVQLNMVWMYKYL